MDREWRGIPNEHGDIPAGYVSLVCLPSLSSFSSQVKGNFVWPLLNERRCADGGEANQETKQTAATLGFFLEHKSETSWLFVYNSADLFFLCMGLKDKVWEFVLLLFFFWFALINPGDLFRIKCGFECPQGWELILGWVWTVSLHVQSLLFWWILKSVFPKVWVLIQLREVSFEHVVFEISMWWIDFYTAAGIQHVFFTGASGAPDLLISYSEGPPFWCQKETPTGCYLGITMMTWDMFWCFKFLSLQWLQ